MPRKILILMIAAAVSLAGWKGLTALLNASPVQAVFDSKGDDPMPQKIQKTDGEWKKELSREQYRVMRQCGTEPPFSGKYNDYYEKGTYVCAGCRAPLFASGAKYDHGTGWPSFTAPFDGKNVEYRKDRSLLMERTEVRCAVCGAHLGHVFDDGPGPGNLHYCINSAALDFIPEAPPEEAREGMSPARQDSSSPGTSPKAESVIFAAGCFWSVEAKFRELEGVIDTTVGYTGGTKPSPTYKEVCSDKTGHAEAVRVTYDPKRISYGRLVEYFFSLHDPTQVNRQGPDVGTQYRSVIFYKTPEQRDIAHSIIHELATSGKYRKPIATQVIPETEFYKAEEYHQRYLEKKQGRR